MMKIGNQQTNEEKNLRIEIQITSCQVQKNNSRHEQRSLKEIVADKKR